MYLRVYINILYVHMYSHMNEKMKQGPHKRQRRTYVRTYNVYIIHTTPWLTHKYSFRITDSEHINDLFRLL